MEDTILEFMMAAPGQPYSDRHVGRSVNRELFKEDQHWARPYLELLVRNRRLTSDAHGYYFQFPEDKDKYRGPRAAFRSTL
jgi:hypothetical protein